MSYYDFGLDWIDQKKLMEVVQTTFSRALGLGVPSDSLPPDPFTVTAHTMIMRSTFYSAMNFEHTRRINKTLSNSVGNMHQKILGLAENWQDMGVNGGLVDLKTIPGYLHPRFGKPVVAEVKNRFNTIKASNEPKVWDDIDNACKVNNGAQGYLFQIVPKTPHRYDCEWAPSNRTAKKNIRVCDGVTAYEMVFGEKHALRQLFLVIPRILQTIQRENGLPVQNDIPTEDEMLKLYRAVFPD